MVTTLTRTSQIHPINAHYLLVEEPYRVYKSQTWDYLEIVVERFSHAISDILCSPGGIIAVGYRDMVTYGEKSYENTFILWPDWSIQAFQSSTWILPNGISHNILYMMLNLVEIHGWQIQDKEMIPTTLEWIDFWKFVSGINLIQTDYWLTGASISLIRTREQYLDTLK